MSSKRRLRRKSCGHKLRHPTYDGALIHLGKLKQPGLVIYKCQFGNHFHVGHPPKRVRQAIRAQREDKR